METAVGGAVAVVKSRLNPAVDKTQLTGLDLDVWSRVNQCLTLFDMIKLKPVCPQLEKLIGENITVSFSPDPCSKGDGKSATQREILEGALETINQHRSHLFGHSPLIMRQFLRTRHITQSNEIKRIKEEIERLNMRQGILCKALHSKLHARTNWPEDTFKVFSVALAQVYTIPGQIKVMICGDGTLQITGLQEGNNPITVTAVMKQSDPHCYRIVELKNGKLDGVGSLIRYGTDGTIKSEKYIGNFKGDKYHGAGTKTLYINREKLVYTNWKMDKDGKQEAESRVVTLPDKTKWEYTHWEENKDGNQSWSLKREIR